MGIQGNAANQNETQIQFQTKLTKFKFFPARTLIKNIMQMLSTAKILVLLDFLNCTKNLIILCFSLTKC